MHNRQRAGYRGAKEECSPGEGVTTILGGAGLVEGTRASYDAYRPRPVEINTANTPHNGYYKQHTHASTLEKN